MAVTVFVEVALKVPGSVGLVVFVAVVVRVDVLDCVGLREGSALSRSRCLAFRFTCMFPDRFSGAGGVVAIPPSNENKMNHFIFLHGRRMFSLPRCAEVKYRHIKNAAMSYINGR